MLNLIYSIERLIYKVSMEPNATSSGPGPVGNKRNSVKKLLDAYHDLIGGGDQPGQDGQGGPGMPAPGAPVKPQMPAAPSLPSPQMQAPGKPPMAMPGGSSAGAPPIAQKPMIPGLGGGPMPGGAPQMPGAMPGGSPTGAPPIAQPPMPPAQPGMNSGPEQDIAAIQNMYGKFGGGAGAPGAATSTPGAGGGMFPGVMGAMKGAMGGAMGMGGNLLKTITDHLHNSRQSHMDHEKAILQDVIKSSRERGGGAPDSMRGHEQDYFDNTRNMGAKLNDSRPNPKKKAAVKKATA